MKTVKGLTLKVEKYTGNNNNIIGLMMEVSQKNVEKVPNVEEEIWILIG